MSLYSGNSVRWTHAVYSLYGLRSGKAFTQHFHYSDSLGISLSEHVALLSSSIPTDSEISFYYNIFAARIAKKLGFHTKVQVTDFVSRLATRQHCRAEASESSWGGFCRSTWNQSTLELQVHPLSAWACPSLCIWAPTFWLSSSETSREVPKCLLTFLGEPSGMFRVCLTRWTRKT